MSSRMIRCVFVVAVSGLLGVWAASPLRMAGAEDAGAAAKIADAGAKPAPAPAASQAPPDQARWAELEIQLRGLESKLLQTQQTLLRVEAELQGTRDECRKLRDALAAASGERARTTFRQPVAAEERDGAAGPAPAPQPQPTLRVVNQLAWSIEIRVNRNSYPLRPGETIEVIVPEGTVEYQIPGEPPKYITVGPLTSYHRLVSIVPRTW